MTNRLLIMGQGYVGLPVAMRAVEVGFHVVGFDLDEARIELLRAGQSYVADVPSDDVARALESARYVPTSDTDDLAGFDVAVISVPTPLVDGAPDLGFIESAGRLLAPHVRAGVTVVLESTTYPGTTEELLAPALESGSGLRAGTDFHLGYSPERIDPGNSRFGFVEIPKVVSGVDAASLAAVRDFYDRLVTKTVPVSGTREAELTKLLENTFRHVNVALVNELAVFAHDLGIDLWEAIDAASSKPFGYMRFTPGPGVGGHCLPVDPSYLSWSVQRSLGEPFRFVELANEVNARMPGYVVQRIMRALNEQSRALNGSRILLLGLAYKPNTADARGSPALEVASALAQLGAQVRAVDGHVDGADLPEVVTCVEVTAEEIASADMVVLLTDHDDVDYALVEQHARLAFDTRHRLKGDNVEHL
jgi:nucleotide sugar dehydrogenase